MTPGCTGLWVGTQLDPRLPVLRVLSDGQNLRRFASAKRSPRGGVRGIETVQAPQGQGSRPTGTFEVLNESCQHGPPPGLYPVTIGPPTFEYWPPPNFSQNTPSTASGARTP